jgi:hypothetical protein
MSQSPHYRARRWIPTNEQAEFLRAIEPTSRFLDDLPDDIRKKYAGQWIAARDAKIIAAAPTRSQLFKALGPLDDPYTLKRRLEEGVNIRRQIRL